MKPRYRSSIPKAAQERIRERYPDGAKSYAEYLLNGEGVGRRWFHETGEPSLEYALKNGVRHGMEYRWDSPGRLLSTEPFINGQPHGVARQWAADGTLIGTYTMKRGTGIDIWWSDCGPELYPAEVYYIRDGARHGFEWWLRPSGRLLEERHWANFQPHGIERCWNLQGRLRRGYPRYFVSGQRVTLISLRAVSGLRTGKYSGRNFAHFGGITARSAVRLDGILARPDCLREISVSRKPGMSGPARVI